MSTTRLYFIDAVRAFAILMMLQGHFIDTLLEVSYRDESLIGFKVWKYFRGITAPTFFTISGFIFSYLLIRGEKQGNGNLRIRKGLARGIVLIGIGYLLRIPIFGWLIGEFSSYFLIVDVLQCIGLSLICIVCFYRFCCKKTIIFSICMLLLGATIFLTEPLYRNLELANTPKLLSNYLTKDNGSVFTFIPWFGYICFGAFISTLFCRYIEQPRFKPAIVLGFLIIGSLLITKSSWFFIKVYNLTGFQLLKDVAWYNYLFTRFGSVLILFSLFYLFEDHIKRPLIVRIGQKTLSIYIVHFIIIYGSFTGLGLRQLIGKTLVPWQAITGAILFLTVVCFISFYYAKTNMFIYSGIRKISAKLKRKSSI